MTSSNVRNGWLPLGAMETSIPNLVDCCLESIIDLRFCGGVARSKLSPRNRLTNTEVVDELVDECATARCWSKCVGMFTVVNPKDSSRPGRWITRLEWIVSTASPRDCFSRWVAELWRPHRGWITRPMKLLTGYEKDPPKEIQKTRPKHHQNKAFWLIQWPFQALLRTGVEDYICQACLAHLHSLHLVSANCVTSVFTHMFKKR